MERTILDILRGMGRPGDIVDYEPDVQKIFLPKGETGEKINREICTESLKWFYLGEVNKRRIVVPVEKAKYYLNLRGTGLEKANFLMNMICKECYSSKVSGIEAQPLTKEIWEKLPIVMRRGVYLFEGKKSTLLYTNGDRVKEVNDQNHIWSFSILPIIVL